ncbi:LysR family transcriptional regulator [Burkholderia multivorans]|nr:LysR family transcriptional regulator [Burkholderia multivorans]PRE23725.1 LysR family transcriptional regulator [Burkholderia multivorans]
MAEAGSLSGAARTLHVDHATVGRRLTALEQSLNTKLIDRQAHRCVLTDEGRLVLCQTAEMQKLAFSIQRVLDHAHQGLSGTITVSAPPVLVRNLLASSVVKLRAQYPNIRLAMSGETAPVSLSKRQADIAIRLSRPTEHEIVVRKLGEMRFGLYGSSSYLAGRNASDFEFIASTDKCANMPHEVWLREYAAGRRVALENDDLSTHLEAARSGVGIAALPCFIADPVPELVHISPEQYISREIWLLTHRDARRSPAMRAVIQFLSDLIHTHRYLGVSKSEDGQLAYVPPKVAEPGSLHKPSAEAPETARALPG